MARGIKFHSIYYRYFIFILMFGLTSFYAIAFNQVGDKPLEIGFGKYEMHISPYQFAYMGFAILIVISLVFRCIKVVYPQHNLWRKSFVLVKYALWETQVVQNLLAEKVGPHTSTQVMVRHILCSTYRTLRIGKWFCGFLIS